MSKFQFSRPWLAGIIILATCLVLDWAAPPWYVNFPGAIVLGYLGYPFLMKLFKEKLAKIIDENELAKIIEPEEQAIIAFATFKLPLKVKEPAKSLVTVIIFWMVGETVIFLYSIIAAIFALMVSFTLRLIH